MERIPVTRRQINELGERARRFDNNVRRGITRRVHAAAEFGFVQRLQGIADFMHTIIEVISFSAVLIWDILKYVAMIIAVILAFIGVYYVFKYILLFAIWIQNTLT